MRTWLALAGISLTLLPLATGVAASDTTPQYDETALATDTPDDYPENGALDLIALFAKERHDGTLDADVLDVRLQLRAPQETQAWGNGTTFRFILGYTLDGTAHQVAAQASQHCAPTAGAAGVGYECQPLQLPRPHFLRDDGVHLILPEANVAPGSALTSLWAATATIHGDQALYHDVLPGAGNSVPRGSEFSPPASTVEYTTRGPFPYLTLVSVSDDDLYVQPGGEGVVDVVFRVHDGVPGLDAIRWAAQMPSGWTATGNLGPTIRVGPEAREYACRLTFNAPPTAEHEARVPVLVDAVLESVAGRQRFPIDITVVDDARVRDADYTFELHAPGPFRQGEEALLLTSVARDGVPLVRYAIEYDLYHDGRLVATLPTSYVNEGQYEARYAFPESGEWQVQAFVSELRPAPATVFEVQVQSQGGSPLPGPGLFLMFALASLAAWTKNRGHDNP